VTYVYRPPSTPVSLEPKPTSAARTSLSRIMTLHDTNLHGNVHGGVILHLVDELGGAVAARHSGGRAVTASMDEFQFLVPVTVGDLVRADAQVNWAGRTSMEVGVRVVAERWDEAGTEPGTSPAPTWSTSGSTSTARPGRSRPSCRDARGATAGAGGRDPPSRPAAPARGDPAPARRQGRRLTAEAPAPGWDAWGACAAAPAPPAPAGAAGCDGLRAATVGPVTADLPAEVQALLEQRAAARAARDFAESDRLRDALADAGWLVRDTAEGQQLSERPPYDVLPDVRSLPDRSAEPDARRCTVALLVEGWPDDVRTCVEALLAHAPDDVVVVLLENGPTDAGAPVHELAEQHPGRVEELHLDRPAGWGEARQALLRADVAHVHVLMDVSTVLEGDALTPLLDALDDDGVAGAGWKGADVEDGWTSFADAGPARWRRCSGTCSPSAAARRCRYRCRPRRASTATPTWSGATCCAKRAAASSCPRPTCRCARTGTAATTTATPPTATRRARRPTTGSCSASAAATSCACGADPAAASRYLHPPRKYCWG
jgi:uncharacterized protein (TIGR00369 family)